MACSQTAKAKDAAFFEVMSYKDRSYFKSSISPEKYLDSKKMFKVVWDTKDPSMARK